MPPIVFLFLVYNFVKVKLTCRLKSEEEKYLTSRKFS